jgi:hypothetical protein
MKKANTGTESECIGKTKNETHIPLLEAEFAGLASSVVGKLSMKSSCSIPGRIWPDKYSLQSSSKQTIKPKWSI